MILRKNLIGIVLSLSFCCSVFADRELSGTETNQILQKLTSNLRTIWMQAGTIEAAQEEYRAPKTTDEQYILSETRKRIEEYQNDDEKAEIADSLQKMALDAIPFNVLYRLSNEYTMKKSTILSFDGIRYYLDITVDSRQDSVQVPDELKGNYKTEQYNLNWNGRRIVCFDGENLTTYNPAINHALIETTNIVPSGSISLLSIGIIPWGYGNYTYEQLTKIKSAAVEKSVDGYAQIHLTLTHADGSESIFVLDPAKSYAPLSWIVEKADSTTVNLYNGYKLISGSWVPTSIVIEKFDAATNKLLAGDYININSISGEIPSSESFRVDFGANTLIERFYDITKPELIYFSSNTANTELLMAERVAYMASEDAKTQNCATASLQYAAMQLGKNILDQQLSQLVNPVDQKTSLLDMKKYAENLGFYCEAVTTDIETLRKLSGCKAILHIPGRSHFVLLDHVDDKYVWIIDLTDNKFYYRTDISLFSLDWTEGTALLISNKPITLPAEAVEIPSDQLIGYTGGSGWSCTYLIQSSRIIRCILAGYSCDSRDYQVIYPRWGCEYAESGSCPEDIFIQKKTYPCYYEPYIVGCQVLLDEMQIYYMWACK